MISQETIEEVKNRLIKVYNPVTIYLFGSYAWGNPDEDSDLDLLIVVDSSDEKRHKRGIPGSRSLRGMLIPKDILVFTKDEFDSWAQNVTTLCYKVKNTGKILYARA